MKITLKDGSLKEVEKGKAIDIVKQISEGLARAAIAVKINGEVTDLSSEVSRDCSFEVMTFDDDEGRRTLRHTASHILAQAVKRLHPEAKLAIGPAIENGFYYDFDVPFAFSTEDLEAIEKEMSAIVKEDLKLERFSLPREEALKFMENEPYKVELISDLPEDEEISFYRQGEFTDLCAGAHVMSTGRVKAFKLTSVAGAYWRGSEKNKMLQRIYGTAFLKKSELDEYIEKLEEAKKRDHRKLGKELDLYAIMDEGPGFPFFFPKGMVIRNELENYWRELHRKYGYEEIKTPIILNRELWETSGHWEHYRENMYTTVIDECDFAIKPMNCPGGILAYKRKMWSYKELPCRYGELGLVHRHELSGALHGLMRVRAFTQDDAHIFLTPEQIRDEVIRVYNLTSNVYDMFGFKYSVKLSTRPEKSTGTAEQWETAEEALKSALDARGVPYTINEGDGAFYGPKIDFHLEDSIGRTWQCGTLQLDFQLPERFELAYIGADGEKHRPVMIHRVVFGSIERFIGILTEHFAGAFPTWLSPVQVKILTLTERNEDYARSLEEKLNERNIRVETDLRNEKIGFKIREARLSRVPYIIVIGDKEQENGTVSVRSRQGEMGAMGFGEFSDMVAADIANKKID